MTGSESKAPPGVVEGLRREIEVSGPMPFDRFMEASLYGPGGYFQSPVVRSQRDGDFLTSPEVSPAFGGTLAKAVSAERARVGEPFTVVEVGAGTGSLLQPLLAELEVPPSRVVVVEVSPGARGSLRARLPGVEVSESFEDVRYGVRGVVVANELLDNLPAALVVKRGSGWRERAVVINGTGLAWAEIEPRREVVAWADAHGGCVPDGGQVEVQLEAGRWLAGVLERLTAGAVIIIDYGDTAEGLESRRPDGTMRTYRHHHLGPDPLLDPGSTDVTIDVNFTALASIAMECGAETELWRQDEYLARWGLLDMIGEMKQREFEAAAAGTTMERLRLRDLVTGAQTLLHPRGLGDFRVLVVRV